MEDSKINTVTCSRCRKEILVSQSITKTIIGRGRKQVYDSWKKKYVNKACVTKESMIFCSDSCYSCEQMSREG